MLMGNKYTFVTLDIERSPDPDAIPSSLGKSVFLPGICMLLNGLLTLGYYYVKLKICVYKFLPGIFRKVLKSYHANLFFNGIIFL